MRGGTRVAREGFSILFYVFIINLLVFAAYFIWRSPVLLIVLFFTMLSAVFVFYFFRDPDRKTAVGANAVVSPGDGTVLSMQPVYEGDFCQDERIRISIFLSIFNVHVNRIPLEGVVKYIRAVPGRFRAAWDEKASVENEQVAIGLETKYGKIMCKQIAGLVARRIVCHLNENDSVETGQRYGIIKFGSRMDLFLPKNIQFKVKVGDKVKGGTTILGEFYDGKQKN